jgi:hypothetical protein
MAAVTAVTEMSRSAARRCRDLSPSTTEKRTSGAEWLTCLLLAAACQRNPSLALSISFGPLSCGDI